MKSLVPLLLFIAAVVAADTASVDTLIIFDGKSGKSLCALNGKEASEVDDGVQTKARGLKVAIPVKRFTGDYELPLLDTVDLSPYQFLEFDVRGSVDSTDMRLTLGDIRGRQAFEVQVDIADWLAKGNIIKSKPNHIKIPLNQFYSDLKSIKSLIFKSTALYHKGEGEEIVYLDRICFTGHTDYSPARNMVIKDSVIGTTIKWMGVNHDGNNVPRYGEDWRPEDMLDCGINSVRIRFGQELLEPKEIDPLLTPAEIKKNPLKMNWQAWSESFENAESYAKYWRDIKPGSPLKLYMDLRPHFRDSRWRGWMAHVPKTQKEKDAWWKFVFALATWCNKIKGYGFENWEILNEPENEKYSFADVNMMTALTWDALTAANEPVGVKTFLHGPAASYPYSPYIDSTLKRSKKYLSAVSYHDYDGTTPIRWRNFSYVKKQVDKYQPGMPVWNTEWGTFNESYNSMNWALGLSWTVFDWTLDGRMQGMHLYMFSSCGNFWRVPQGLIWEVNNTVSFYVYRMLCRSLNGGKKLLKTEMDGNDIRVLCAQDAAGMDILALNPKSIQSDLTIDVSNIRAGIDSAGLVYTFSEKSTGVDGKPVSVAHNQLSAVVPAQSLVRIHIPAKNAR